MSKPTDQQHNKVRIAVHKFSSCDGCQLAFINAVNAVLALSDYIDILHFAEAGPCDPDARVDIAFVEGSISTPHDIERIKQVRENSGLVVTIGACATSGSLQALRNMADHDAWRGAIYTSPEHIDSLATSTSIAEHIHVDHELWGCPINTQQLLKAITAWLSNSQPEKLVDSVCGECKRRGNSCVMVTHNIACMGPVTRTGCGALCPSFHRGCYGCYGPAELINTESLATHMQRQNVSNQDIANHFLGIHSHTTPFNSIGTRFKDMSDAND